MTVLFAEPSSFMMLIVSVIVIVALVFIINPSIRKLSLGFAIGLLILVSLPALYVFRSTPRLTATVTTPQISLQSILELPEWANKPRHWEGDTYVVPLATAFGVRSDGGDYGSWEQEMDRAATIELEQVVRGAIPEGSNPNFGGQSQSAFQHQYNQIKHRICGPERHLEAATGTATQTYGSGGHVPTRYRMHGVLRFDPATREQLREELSRIWTVKLVWQTPPAIETVATAAAAQTPATHDHASHDVTTVTVTPETPHEHEHAEHETATTPATTAETEAEPTPVSASASGSEKPSWVDQPPHHEGDTYVVPVASGFEELAPTNDSIGDRYWEEHMDAAAIIQLEQAIRATMPLRPHFDPDGSYWIGIYKLVKFKIWGPERYIEKVTIAISPRPRYQLHGVMRITPEVRKILEPKLSLVSALHRATAGGAVATAVAGPSLPLNVFLVLPLLILLLVAIIALVAHPRTRRGALVAIAGLVLTVPLLRYLVQSQLRQNIGGFTNVEHLPQSAAPSESIVVGENTSASAKEVSTTSDAAATPKPPAWVDQPNKLDGNIYHASLKSGLFVTDQECEKELQAKLRATANGYLDDLLGSEASKKLDLGPDMRSLVKDTYRETVTSTTMGPMRQIHALLQFDDRTRFQLVQKWQAVLAFERLTRVALAAGAILGLLAIAFAYLKFDLRTAGQIRGRLRFAAVGAIIVLATSVAAACRAFEL